MIFPVKVPYTVSADITKYLSPAFNPIPSKSYISQKQGELEFLNSQICHTETQTTVGFDDQLCFFFVKVNMMPLEVVWVEKEKRELILDSINSMSENILYYKNLYQVKKMLNLL